MLLGMTAHSSRLTRRKVLKGAGATAGALALAGCSGAGGSWKESRMASFFTPFQEGNSPWQKEHKVK